MPRGESIGEAYIRVIADGSGMGRDVHKDFDDLDLEKEGRKSSESWRKGLHDDIEKNKKKMQKDFSDPLARGHFLRDDFFKGENWKSFRKDLETNYGKAGKLVGTRFEQQLLEGMSFDDLDKGLRNLTPHLLKAHKDIKGGFDDRPVSKFRQRLEELDVGIDLFAAKTGKAFGHGSRNNFLNFFGGIVKGGVGVLNIFPKMIKGFTKLTDAGSKIGDVFTEAGGGFSGLTAAGGKLAPMLLSATAGVIAIGVAVGLLAVIIGPVVALISGLAAAVTALASSLVFAAVGAVAPLAGALLPLIAGFGVLALGIYNLNSTAQKAMTKAIKPLTSQLKGLTVVAGDVFKRALPGVAKGLGTAFGGLRPLVRGIAEGLVSGVRDMVRVLNSPAWRSFVATMTDFLPQAVRQLGHIFANTFAGLLGVFRSLVPSTQTFLNWLVQITREFRNWANSTGGQVALLTFFHRAADSVHSVWGFIIQAGKALATLLSAGKGGGDSIFDDMANALKRFTAYLNRNPGAVAKWFANGVKTARDIGHAIQAISIFFRKLDTPANRKLAHQLFDGLSTAIRTTAAVLGAASGVVQTVVGQFRAWYDISKAVSGALIHALGGALGYIVGAAGHVLNAFGSILSGLGKIPGPFRSRFAAAGAAMTAAGGKATALSGKLQGIKAPRPINISVKSNGGSLTSIINQIANLGNHLAGLHSKDLTITTHMVQHGNKVPTARGGLFGGMANFAQNRFIGESGREAVVPLDRPLGQIDPSVRAMAALVQGKSEKMASGGIVGGGRSISADGWTIVSNSEDSKAVAAETWARLVGAMM